MKYRIAAGLLCGTVCVTMTGCNLFFRTEPPTPVQTTTPTETEVSETEAVTEVKRKYPLQECTVDNVSFAVNGSWEHQPVAGYEGTYLVPELEEGYQLQGTSPLGSYSPDAFFETLLEFYQEQYTVGVHDDTLQEFRTADGLDGYVGHVEMTSSGTFFSIDVLIVPQKNMVVTFSGQCREGKELSTDIRELTETATFNIGTRDTVSGRTFTVDDGSELQLQHGDTFRWYEEMDGAYVDGTYEVYYGQDAVDAVVAMEEYGVTEEELDTLLTANRNGYALGTGTPADLLGGTNRETYQVCLDTFYAIILYNKQLTDGDEVTELTSKTLYIGYYLPELDCLDLTNANTANHTRWDAAE